MRVFPAKIKVYVKCNTEENFKKVYAYLQTKGYWSRVTNLACSGYTATYTEAMKLKDDILSHTDLKKEDFVVMNTKNMVGFGLR